jgi:hypothetical protein
MGKCLFAKVLPSNGYVYLFIKSLFPSSGCCFILCFEDVIQELAYTPLYIAHHYVLLEDFTTAVQTDDYRNVGHGLTRLIAPEDFIMSWTCLNSTFYNVFEAN